MAGLAAVRRLQVAADSAVIVAKRVATPLLTVQHQALVHGLRLLDMPRTRWPSCDLASLPVDAASLVAGWENDHHLEVKGRRRVRDWQKVPEGACRLCSSTRIGACYRR